MDSLLRHLLTPLILATPTLKTLAPPVPIRDPHRRFLSTFAIHVHIRDSCPHVRISLIFSRPSYRALEPPPTQPTSMVRSAVSPQTSSPDVEVPPAAPPTTVVRVPRAARSFADDLRARSDDELAALLLARPDLTRPAPADITSLAARASTRASVQRALEHLDGGALRLVEALLVVGADGAAAALGASKKAVEQGIRELWAKALVWRASDGWRTARAVGEILTHPAGLGRSTAELVTHPSTLALSPTTTPDEVADAEARLTDRARAVIEQLRWGSARASFTTPALRAVRDELVRAGLMVALDGDDAVIPREVGLALRGGRLSREPWAPPQPEPRHVDQADADTAAAGEVLDLLWRLDDVAAAWDEEAPRVLRTGGLSVRDHRRLAARLDASSELTAFVLEIGHAAGLFASDGEIDATWRPTDLYDEWTTWSPARRWAALALAWRDTVRAPGLAGQSVDGTLVNVLGKDAAWPLMRARRRDVLDVLAALPAGSAPTIDGVEALLRWRRPLRLPAGAPTHADVVLREAAWLGVLGRGALTSAGRALLAADPSSAADVEAVTTAMSTALPEPVDQVMLQGDLTAIAPGPLAEEAATFMRRAADVESRGGATVFRFSDASLRRLLDHGVSSAEALELLRRHSMTPIPQALEYLLGDVARRHGHVRVGSVSSYVRSDDEAALDALVADTGLASLQLRRIAPTVCVSPMPAATLLDVLREHRHAPVAETSDGGVVVRAATVERAPTPSRRTTPVQVHTLDAGEAEQLAGRLRAAEKDAVRPSEHDAHTRIPSCDPTVTLALLQDAAAESVPVWIGYVEAGGDIKRGLFRPASVTGGRVTGQLGDTSPVTRTFSIHRITGVASA